MSKNDNNIVKLLNNTPNKNLYFFLPSITSFRNINKFLFGIANVLNDLYEQAIGDKYQNGLTKMVY